MSQTGATLSRTFSWSTSDAAVASVSSSGLVSALGAGTATVTVSAEGRSATATVTVPAPGPPIAPNNVSAAGISETEIRVRWNDNSADEDAFVVYRESGDAYVEIARTDANVTEFVDTGLGVGSTHRYVVSAVNAFGESEQSAYAEGRTFRPLVIVTDSLPTGVVGNEYFGTLRAEGGPSTAYSWTILEGRLPDGLTIGGSGAITGRPFEGGSFPLTVRVVSGANTVTAEVRFEVIVPQADATYTIQLVYTVEPSEENRAVFESAKARWESIITRGVTEQIGGHLAGCPPAADQVVDDILISVTLDSIDGPFNTLGFAGPCQLRFLDGLPISGRMTFDTADVARLRQSGRLQATILHEMGHVLGIGTLWQTFQLVDGACVGMPTYTGPRGVAAWQGMGGTGSVPVYGEGAAGDGSNCSHWDESTFQTELMTPQLNGSGPMSALSIESLADFGYVVDATQADAYTLPGSGGGAPALSAGAAHPPEEAVMRLLRPRYRRTPDGRFLPLPGYDGNGGER